MSINRKTTKKSNGVLTAQWFTTLLPAMYLVARELFSCPFPSITIQITTHVAALNYALYYRCTRSECTHSLPLINPPAHIILCTKLFMSLSTYIFIFWEIDIAEIIHLHEPHSGKIFVFDLTFSEPSAYPWVGTS